MGYTVPGYWIPGYAVGDVEVGEGLPDPGTLCVGVGLANAGHLMIAVRAPGSVAVVASTPYCPADCH